MTKAASPKPEHYHLITAEIIFRNTKEESGETYSMRLNGVLSDATQQITHRLLGKAQQIVQMHFHSRMENTNIEVVDVVLMGFSYLGYMTSEEFLQPPEGTKIQVKKPPIHKDPLLSTATPTEGTA